MPIIINEVVIRATVGETTAGPGPGREQTRRFSLLDRKTLIEACVQEVLRILKEKRER